MAKHTLNSSRSDNCVVEVKSKFVSEFRRFALMRDSKYDDFVTGLERLHGLDKTPFVITYTEPVHGDVLPINNNDNFSKALSTAKPLLRLLIQRKGESYGEINGYGSYNVKRRNPISKLLSGPITDSTKPRIQISLGDDFRRVSAIIDVDIVPETHRRVRLIKNGPDKPLGFYIRDGWSVRIAPHGLEKVPGIFVSRLMHDGLAESTGLLAVNDEVLEVNGIEVAGKTLDQVTDMMVANSSNLIITVKPVNQRMTLASQRGSALRGSPFNGSQASSSSHQSYHSAKTSDSELPVTESRDDEEDEVQDHLPDNNADGDCVGTTL